VEPSALGAIASVSLNWASSERALISRQGF
jgi:hypothetical protein